MLPPRDLPEEPFLSSEAFAAGIGRARLRRRDVEHPHHGVYVVAMVDDADLLGALVRRCEALARVLGDAHCFSHATAARLHGIPLPFEMGRTDDLHVIARRDAAPVRRPGVVGWETASTSSADVRLGRLRVAAPADVWTQLAVPGAVGRFDDGGRRVISHEALVAAADFLLTGPFVPRGQRRPLCTLAELAAAVAKRKGRRGVKALVEALPRVRAGAHSPQETRLRLRLVDYGLPEPVVQLPVMTAEGLRHADLGYPEQRLLLEYHGDHHRTDRAQWLADLTRRQLFEDAGYRVVEVGAHDLAPDFLPLAARVRRAL